MNISGDDLIIAPSCHRPFHSIRANTQDCWPNACAEGIYRGNLRNDFDAPSFAVFDAMSGRSSHAAFAAFNAAVLLFCLARYIGFRNSLEDLGIPMPRSGWSTLMRGEAREFRATRGQRKICLRTR